MEWYILKSVAILAVLLLFYKLLLEKENMHSFKRFYLLFAVLASVGIPLITITTYVEPVAGNFDTVLFHYSEEVSVAESRSFADYLPYVLWSIYALGVIFFSLKFIRNLRELLLKIRTNPKIKKGSFTRILLREKVDPHTFFSYIFLNRRKYEQEQIPREVIIHEEAHARQKHSLDILFVELLQIVFWMNPLIILLKDAVKLNHEFLADRAVIEKGVQTAGYQNTLLSFSSGHLQSDLVNPINYSSIKKRFKVMKTRTSKKAILARGFLILPLISLLFFSFSNKEIVERGINTLPAETMNATTLMLEVDETGKVYFQNNETNLGELRKHIRNASYTSYHIEVAENSSPSLLNDLIKLMAENKLKGSVATCTITGAEQDKATPEMIAEYNRLVKDLNETGVIRQQDLNRIKVISKAMTAEQKKNSVQPKYEMFPAKGSENGKQGGQAQEKATPEMIAEYNRLVKYYNAMQNGNPEGKLQIKQEDINRIMAILSRMTPEQKEEAEKIKFDVPPPPPPAPAPGPQTPPAPEKRNVDVPPAPPAPVQGNMQAPPPPPPSPKEAVKDWIEEGAVFYYNGKKTTGQNVLEIVQKNDGKNLDVQIQEDSSGKTVRISDKKRSTPISSDKDKNASVGDKSINPVQGNMQAPPSSASQTSGKKLTLLISPNVVVVNGKSASIRGVAKLVDEATKDWSPADFNLHGLEIKTSPDVSKDFINRLNVELEKTKLVRYLDMKTDFIPYSTKSISTPQAPAMEKYLTKDSKIYLDGKIISAEDARELLKANRDQFKVSIHQNGENNTIITMEQT